MQKYIFKGYQEGVEPDQARIGIEVARSWIWPYAYDLDDLSKAHAQPDLDADTSHFCFLGEKMVGYVVFTITPAGDGDISTANLDFPRLVPGHEPAAELLMARAFETLARDHSSFGSFRLMEFLCQ
jgi:hypothetical protein